MKEALSDLNDVMGPLSGLSNVMGSLSGLSDVIGSLSRLSDVIEALLMPYYNLRKMAPKIIRAYE